MVEENKISNQQIYKIKKLINGEVDTIYVFNGQIITESEEDLFSKIFNEKEINEIKEKNISVKFSEQQINLDDSILTIKIKILKELKQDISIDEIYLFCQKIELLNAVNVYQSLTQNGKLQLTKVRLEQFVSNIVSDENGKLFDKPPDKDFYTFDDIFEMKFNDKKYIVNKVLGQKFFIVENEYPFVSNPFDVFDYDQLLEKNARKSLTTLNNHLLLNNGDIFSNSIYVCLATDVLSYVSQKNVSEESTIKIYYPFLYNKNINTFSDLEEERNKLIENNKKILNEKVIESFKTIDMFYNVYKLRTNELNYVKKGIKYIKAIIKPEFDVKIPLEIIFKIIHATKENPLIKYNPSSRQENIYRLFTDKISTDGRKIPFLKKSTIFKLMKTIAKNKSVAVYIETGEQSFVCEFDEEGYITIIAEFKNIVNIYEINNIFKTSINPIIQEIKVVLEQSGYKLNNFESLNDSNVEIKQLTYETQIIIKKPLNIEKYKNCISSVFINETNKFKGNTINLRFKRVSNYSKFTSQEAFILEKSAQGLRGKEIIEALLENFTEDLNHTDAVEMVMRIANELEVEHGVRKSDIKIKNNPGFKTVISLEKLTGIITITTENINNINYLNTLPIYIDTIVRLTQDKNSTLYPIEDIDRVCRSKNTNEITVNDIISSLEESANHSEVAEIQDEEVVYDKIGLIPYDKPKGALSLFFDDEDDDDDADETNTSEDFKGGNESDSSISTEITSPGQSDNTILSNNENELESFPSENSVPSNNENELESFPSETITDEKSILSNNEQPELEQENVNEEPELEQEQEQDNEEPELEQEQEQDNEEPELEQENVNEESEPEQMPKQKQVPESEESEPESESEQEQDQDNEEPESELEPEEDEVRDIDGMKLNKPYYFQSLIEKKDPILILKEDTPQFNSYPRTCSSNMRRQPVILTDEQLEKINKEYPGFLRDEDVIKYGSNPNKQFNYICPRYWCLKTNTIIDPKDLKEVKGKDGKIELIHPTCGKVLPKGEKIVKPGYYIYEFYKPEHKKVKQYKELFDKTDTDNDGLITFDEFKSILKKLKENISERSIKNMFDYVDTNKDNKINFDELIDATTPKKYPSLIPDSHPDGLCLPCCFDKYNTEGRIKAMEKCNTSKKNGENQKSMLSEKKQEDQDEYIKAPDKFPLDKGRWGYLPVEIQTMLRVNNSDCQISKVNTNIKENHPCLLRHGIEINSKQSFVNCISDILFFAKKTDKKINSPSSVLNLAEMKEHIIQSISIDSFIKYQNGNLVNDFQNSEKAVDINNYKSSKLYSKMNLNNIEDVKYFTKVITAFENFIDYLKDPESIIDHTYLWDIISMPNPQLFPNGVNIIILQLMNDDITNNVSILCPSNHYSSEFYQARKPTIILIKKDEYYEPIYSYTNNNINGQKNILISKEFKEYDPKLSKTMRAIFKEIIKPFFNLVCRPLDSMPNVYKAKRPLLLYDLIQKLDKYEYNVTKLVVNFNNKVIGVLAEEPGVIGKFGFIPCYPSYLDENLKPDLDYVFMNDVSLWNTYNDTVEFLNKLDKRSKKRREQPDIPCKPEFKVVEDDHVVGILTNTNQFIQISVPLRLDEIPPNLDIPSLTNDNYIIDVNKTPMIQSEIEFTTQTDVDKERVDYIKKIHLETSFYNVFRNTIRILINNYENVKTREKIEGEMLKEYIIYSEKLKNINKYLKELVKDKIQFIGDDNYYKLINEVSTCVVKDSKTCNSIPNLCTVSENGDCNLILPEKNLITKKMNEEIYYARMADELIRYNRIKSFILQPQIYISFGNIGYNLRDDEIILIQSLLTQDYFESLIPGFTNKYAKYSSYDEVQPVKTQVYDNVFESLNVYENKSKDVICEKTIKNIKSSIWKSCFPENYNEIEYGKHTVCTFEFIIDLIERKNGIKYTINQIKNQLFDEYKTYLVEYIDKILDILIIEGKKTLSDQVKTGTLSFSNLIYTDNYFLTTLDLWLLVVKHKIPTIFISQKTILQTKYEKHEFIVYGSREDDFAFIIIPGFRPENVPNFKLVLTNTNDAFISLNKLNDNCVERIFLSIENQNSIKDYLEKFMKPKKMLYVKKKPTKPILIETDDDENEEEKNDKIKPKTQRKKKIIINEETPPNIEIVDEEVISISKTKIKPKTNKSKKVAKTNKVTTRKNVKIESSN
jgi:hypothetical protein